MNVKIRKATNTDLECLVPIQNEVQQLHVDALPGEYISVPLEELRRWMSKQIESESVEVIVAESNSGIVGYSIIKFEERVSSPFRVNEKYALVDQLAVLSSSRRKGIATKLLEASSDVARTKGCTEVYLDVLEFNNEALEFYRTAGFSSYRQRMKIDL